MTDEERSIAKRNALEMVAKISGLTVEEAERIVNEMEEQSQKTVRILSMREVESAVAGAQLRFSEVCLYWPALSSWIL